MPLEGLLELVETLRARIDVHGTAIRGSEALTRYALIDPLLRELGWDTSNPDMVVPEYRSGAGPADYALLSSGSPAMMVEAKSLGTTLGLDVVSQILTYSQIQGTDFFCVTDGQRWEAYETHKPVPIDEKRVVSWDLKEAPPAEVSLKALALWRPSVQSGHVAAGQIPVLGLSQDSSEMSPLLEDRLEPDQPGDISTHASTDSQPYQHEDGWTRLSDWNPKHGDPKPTEMMFPDSESVIIRYWYNLVVEPTRWLIQKGFLTPDKCPIFSHGGRRYLVTDNVDLLVGPSKNQKRVGGLYVGIRPQSGVISRRGVKRILNRPEVSYARAIIEHVGQDPAQFKVRFS